MDEGLEGGDGRSSANARSATKYGVVEVTESGGFLPDRFGAKAKSPVMDN